MRAAPDAARHERRPGGACPPVLIGGEETVAAKVDWLTCTFLPELGELVDRNIADWLFPLLGGAGGETVNGFHQYENGLRFWHVADGSVINLGRLDWGGQARAGRARLELTGHGCARVTDWRELRSRIEALSECTLTRVDLAVDLLEGQFDVDDAVEWYRGGDFRAGTSGKQPSHSTIGDWLDDEHPLGRTLMVGKRANGKMCRVYEKGRQLGDQASEWVRFEVELRNNDRDLPFEILTDCDTYFVGAYRCLERVISVAGTRIATHQKEGEIALEVMSGFARTGYGQVLNVLRATGLSFEQVFQEIARPGIPKRLERAALGGFVNGSPPDPLH